MRVCLLHGVGFCVLARLQDVRAGVSVSASCVLQTDVWIHVMRNLLGWLRLD